MERNAEFIQLQNGQVVKRVPKLKIVHLEIGNDDVGSSAAKRSSGGSSSNGGSMKEDILALMLPTAVSSWACSFVQSLPEWP